MAAASPAAFPSGGPGPAGFAPAQWLAGGMMSVLLHAAALALLAVVLAPRPVPQQPVPPARLEIAAQAVERSTATPAEADADRARAATGAAAGLSQAAPPSVRADPVAAPPQTVVAGSAASQTVLAAAPSGAPALGPAAPPSLAAAARPVEATALASATPDAPPAPSRPVEATTLASATPDAAPAAAGRVDATALTSASPDAAPVAAGRVAATALISATPDAAPAAASRVDATALASATPSVASLAASIAEATTVASAAPSAAPAPSRPAEATTLSSAAPNAAPAPSRPTEATILASAKPDVATAAAGRAEATALASATPDATPATARPTEATALASAPPEANPARIQAPDAPALPVVATERLASPAAAATPTSLRATAETAWTGEGAVDEVSLAAIAAFMQPGDPTAAATAVRDGIAAVLAAVPCARLQTTFLPDTGNLELRGHIPEDALRGPVLAALRAQVGAGIAVSDKVLVLPRPQCGALSGVAAVGLPQSTDQYTNPRVIGEDAHVRDYTYAEGQRLEFDLQGPDYPSVVYVDYFDADGNVIHLQPNESVPLQRIATKGITSVGRDIPGQPSLAILIAPPFGQEIAVAFAASAPLYDGLRPLVEPAGPYLEFLRERAAEARRTDPDFKGEWAYFFITTTP